MATKKGNTKSNYKIPYSKSERNAVHRIIRTSIKRGDSPNQIYNKLVDKGLGYRKQNALADIRLKNATINAKTPAARKNSETWFLNVFEPFRKQNKMNSHQAKKLWNKAVDESYKLRSDAIFGKQLRITYEKQFKQPPSQTQMEYGKNP